MTISRVPEGGASAEARSEEAGGNMTISLAREFQRAPEIRVASAISITLWAHRPMAVRGRVESARRLVECPSAVPTPHALDFSTSSTDTVCFLHRHRSSPPLLHSTSRTIQAPTTTLP
ncbi:hypothetical protein L1887_42485 [Cichorium endivia]|nr:hypothetical protein L1887_42485 [Cichorium endivia]